VHYAAAIEEDGVLGEAARRAWKEAARQWYEFGNREIPVGDDCSVRLNDLPGLTQRGDQLRKQFDVLAPGLYEQVRRERKQSLTADLRQALETPPDRRTALQEKLAALAQEALCVPLPEVVDKVDAASRPKAKAIAEDLARLEAEAERVRNFGIIVNYEPWTLHCQIEQSPDALAARRSLYDAREQLREGRMDSKEADRPRARQLFERGFREWRRVFDAHPALYDDEYMCRDLLDIISVYRKQALRQERLPKDFSLQQVIDRHGNKQP
jgi:hypothetical protein